MPSNHPSPTCAVIVTCRDRPHLLPRALASALAQTVEDIEVIVVDDGSSEPIRLATSDLRVRLLRNATPAGASAARNRGLAETTAAWALFLDDDDELKPDAVEVSLEAAHESRLTQPCAVVGALEIVSSDGVVVEKCLPMTVPRGCHYPLERHHGRGADSLNALVAPVWLLREVGGWDESLRAFMHSDLLLRLNARCSIQGTDTVIYRLHEGEPSRLSRNFRARADAMHETRRKHRDVYRLHRDKDAAFTSLMAMYYLRSGTRWRYAIAAMARSLWANPFAAGAWRKAALVAVGPHGLAVLRGLRRALDRNESGVVSASEEDPAGGNGQGARPSSGVDTTFFRPGPPPAAADGSIRLLAVGPLEWRSGLDYVLLAVRALTEQGLDAHIDIHGTGEDHRRLLFMTGDLGVGSRARIGDAPRDDSELRSLLWRADIFVSGSLTDGDRYPLLAAAACGVPIVATAVPPATELLRNGIEGILVPVRDIEAMANAIRSVSPDARRTAPGLGSRREPAASRSGGEVPNDAIGNGSTPRR